MDRRKSDRRRVGRTAPRRPSFEVADVPCHGQSGLADVPRCPDCVGASARFAESFDDLPPGVLQFSDDGGPYRFIDFFDLEDVKVEHGQALLEEEILNVLLCCIDGKLEGDLAEVISWSDILYLESRPIRDEVL
jgi:hypothetical protein